MFLRPAVLTRLQMEGTLALGKLQYKGVLAIADALACPVTAGG